MAACLPPIIQIGHKLGHLLTPTGWRFTFGESGSPIVVPSVCLVELTYLIEKGRIPPGTRQILIDVLDGPDDPYVLKPLDRSVADALQTVPRSEVPDLPDRIIAATALALRLPRVGRDHKIRASQVQTIW